MPDLMDTYIENRERVQPNDTNSLHTAHGGNVMKWMDEIGAMSAMRFAGENCVTAQMDRINFTQPIPVGEVALIRAYVYAAGETSIRVRLNTFHENPRTRETQPTTESYAVYVAINEDREPTSVPDLTVTSDQGHELRERARGDENST